MWVWAPDNGLGAEGAAAALADPLGKLVHLTSLDVRGTWHGDVVCVSRVCMRAVRCMSVSGRLWGCVTDVERSGCVGTRQWAGCRGGSSIGGCAGEAGAPNESELEQYVAWRRGVCVACVCVCMPCCVRVCVGGCGSVKLCG